MITGAVESSRPLIEQYGHELTVSLAPEPAVDGDAVRLSQVFRNLLNYAAKYTERGGRISLTAERQDEAVVVRMKDTGVGILPETLPRLFEMCMLNSAQSALPTRSAETCDTTGPAWRAQKRSVARSMICRGLYVAIPRVP